MHIPSASSRFVPSWWFYILLLFAVFAVVSSAQIPQISPLETPSSQSPGHFSLEGTREAMVSLDGAWRRMVGDNPAWSDPTFDDSNWPVVRPQEPWKEQRFSGTAWYRATVHVPEHYGPLSLFLYYVDDSYQVFVDGHLLSSQGGLPPHPHAYGIPPQLLAIPRREGDEAGHELKIAVRVWLWPKHALSHPGGIRPGSRIGDPKEIGFLFENLLTAWKWRSAANIFISTLELLASLASLCLFFLRRKEREFLWFSILLLSMALIRVFALYFQFHALGWSEQGAVTGLFSILQDFSAIAFYFRLLKGQRNATFWIAVGTNALLALNCIPAYLGLESDVAASIFVTVFALPTSIWIITLITRRALAGFPDARLLIAPVFFSGFTTVTSFASWIGTSTGLIGGIPTWVRETIRWPLPLSLDDIGELVFLIAMLSILIYRFTRSRFREESYERERDAARIVQHVMIPDVVPTVTGLAIESVYRPFGEVGGDFYQILPLALGGALLVIGDVSGKGLPAAMTVSLLIGTLRALAQYTMSPKEILSAMNRSMVGRTNGGFTTCLIIHMSPIGTMTAANAGHISPYLDGAELPIESGLPLGLADDCDYPESAFEFALSSRLTLLTDGIAEARSRTGELFGFERTKFFSDQPAEKIALAAQAFGQDDDITVVSVVRNN